VSTNGDASGKFYVNGPRTAKAIVGEDNALYLLFDGEEYTAGQSFRDTSITAVLGINGTATSSGQVSWNGYRSSITSVVVDESMQGYTPTSMAYWFYNMPITSFTGLDNLNTSQVTNMSYTFANDGGVRIDINYLDLSSWDVSNVTTMFYMFAGGGSYGGQSHINVIDLTGWDTDALTRTPYMFQYCNVQTVYASETFDVSHISQSNNMFSSTPNLVGGNGTVSTGGGSEKAHIDVDGNPGYFTDKTVAKPQAVVCEDGTLYLMYTTVDASKGFTYAVGDELNDSEVVAVMAINGNTTDNYSVSWNNYRSSITSVVVDESMQGYTPTSLAYWFYNMPVTSFTGLDNLNTSQVTNMSRTFSNDGGVRIDINYLDLSSWDVSNVTTMYYMFAGGGSYGGQSHINVIDLTGWDTDALTSTPYMFQYCNVQTVYASETFDVSHISQSNDMFRDTGNLRGGNGTVSTGGDREKAHIDVDGNPGYFTDKTAATAKGIVGANNTLTLVYDTNSYTVGSSFSSSKGTTTITHVGQLFGTNTAATQIPWHEYRSTITDVDIRSSMSAFGVSSSVYWFYNMTNLNSITGLANLDMDNNTNMSYMFYNVGSSGSGITSLDLSSWDVSSVQNMSYMFQNAKIDTIDLTGWTTTVLTNTSYMFSGCTVATIDASNTFSVSHVTSSGNMFYNTPNLVGGNGTHSSGGDASKAHIDELYGAPGYFTDKNATPGVVSGAFAVLTNNSTITFVYGDLEFGIGDTYQGATVSNIYRIPIDRVGDAPAYFNGNNTNSIAGSVTSIVVDESFEDADPVNMRGMFCGFAYATSITGLEYINTEHVVSMCGLFYGDRALTGTLDLSMWDTPSLTDLESFVNQCGITVLDLTGWDTSHVTNLFGFAYSASHLTTVYGTDGLWDMSAVTNSNYAFSGSAVVGGYSGCTNQSYYRIDKDGQPGIITDKNILP
jgi:surface protein